FIPCNRTFRGRPYSRCMTQKERGRGIGGESRAGVDATNTTSKPLVLVVDDDDGIREAIVDLLVEEGFDAVGAGNGLEALNLLAEAPRKPSLILLDLMMPELDGWTFCKVR